MSTSRPIIALLLLFVASPAWAQAPAPSKPASTKPSPANPDFTVAVDGLIVADFTARVAAYAELRKSLEEGLPKLEVTANHSEIRRAEEALARRIRQAREGKRQGDIFTPSINAAFKKLLASVVTPGMCEAIFDDGPAPDSIDYRTNRSYPRDEPLSTVPPSILGVLPVLPEDVQYRFIRRSLILYDTRPNLILDRIPAAISCPPIK
jgi:hypothetical protein